MSKALRGKCFCGRIQFEITETEVTCSHCHCESCRRAHSAPFVTWTSFHKDQLLFSQGKDLLKKYQSSENVSRSFCENCGTPLFYESLDENGIIYAPTASFVDLPNLLPNRHVSFEEKVPWLDITDSLPKYHGKMNLMESK